MSDDRIRSKKELPRLFDGAMGTRFAQVTGESSAQVEAANSSRPEVIRQIHREYLEAGARALLTNTFGLPQMEPEISQPLAAAAVRNAREAMRAAGKEVPLFASLGPGDPAHPAWLTDAVQALVQEGVDRFLFETQADFESLQSAIGLVRNEVPDSQIVVSFAVEADGLTRSGLAVQPLLDEAAVVADGIGLNCLQGPAGMVKLVKSLHFRAPLLVRPNAGTASVIGHRMEFTAAPAYFASVLEPLAKLGISLGGCCGTGPAHTAALAEMLNDCVRTDTADGEDRQEAAVCSQGEKDPFLELFEGRQPVFVEADPPADDDVMPWLAAVKQLKQGGADVITISDNPVGRPRADSCMLAALAAREEEILVLPHIACRDKNRNAIRSLLTGLSISGVHQCLVVTGDPVCEEDRSEVRQVYNFNSRRLAAYIQVLNETVFREPMCVAGALNVNARNFDVQLDLAREKIDNGVKLLLTQPVLSKRGLENLKRAHETLDCRILAGVFPVISERNALYLQNEVSGIELDERIAPLYAGLSRQEAEDLAVRISQDVIEAARAYCDGWYIMMPFRRTALVQRIIACIRSAEKAQSFLAS